MPFDTVPVVEGQARLLESRAKNVGVVGGLGAAKTSGLAIKSIQLAVANQGLPEVGFFATLTRFHVRHTVVPQIVEWAERIGNGVEYFRSLGYLRVHLGDGVRGEMVLISGDRPESLVSLNAPWGIVDEAGLQSDEFLRKARPRVRYRRSRFKQYIEGGTPEGIGNEFHEFVEGGKTVDLDDIRMRTLDNPFLDEDYITTRLAHYSAAELEAYTKGIFVARAGRVYTFFDPVDHETPYPGDPFDGELVLCADFGKRTVPWAIGTITLDEDDEERVHIWGEVLGRGITTWEMVSQMRELVLERYEAERGESIPWDIIAPRITIYCDASGATRSYGDDGISESDTEILIGAGFELEIPTHNPAWRDRVASVQDRLRTRLLMVDPEGAPYITKCLKHQGYNKFGRPQKSKDNVTGPPGMDHGEEAVGYLCHRRWPIESSRDSVSYNRL